MSFKDIKGQDRAIAFLNNSIAGKRIAHAYLFSGPSGVGKKLTAVNFAKALNCMENSRPHPEPVVLRQKLRTSPEQRRGADGCGECVSCRKIDASNHPDVSLLRPEEKGGFIKIDAIRGLAISAGLKPYEGRRKVYIIDDADSMRYDAQNALLKTLEEPPSGSVLILITANPGKLFSTVVSRVQTVRFFPLTTGECQAILAKEHKLDKAAAEALSRLSSGRIGEALRYGSEGFSRKRSRIIEGLIDQTLFISDFENCAKEEMGLSLDIMLAWYRDLLVAKIEGGAMFFNSDKKETLQIEARKTDFEKLYDAVRQIILTASYLKRNVNPKLAMSLLGANITRQRENTYVRSDSGEAA